MATITVTGTKIMDASGNLLASGTIYFTPTVDGKQFNSYRPAGGGTVEAKKVSAQVTNGAFSIPLHDTSLTTPENIRYIVEVYANDGGPNLLDPSYDSFQPTATNPNFDDYVSGTTPGVVRTIGPQGLSAYQLAQEAGFTGTEAEWLASLKGETGNINTPVPNAVEFQQQISVQGQTFEGAGNNEVDASFYVTDDEDRLAFYIDGDGNTHVSGDLSVKGSTDITVSELAAEGGGISDLDTALDYALAIYDDNERVALGVDHEGNTNVSGVLKAKTLAYDGGEVTDLDSDFDYAFAIYDSTERVAFAVRNDGKIVGELADGSSTPDLPVDYDENHVAATGQSLMVGYQSNPPLSTTQPYANLMFTGGPCAGVRQGAALVPANYASKVPLIEVSDTQGDGTFGETMMSAFANRAAYELAKDGRKHAIFATVNGYSGAGYTSIKQGTATYANGITLATAAKTMATAASKSYGIQAVLVEHGQADEGGNYAAYATALAEWQRNYEMDYQAISGQTSKIPFIITQMSEWTRYAKAVGIIPYLQIAAAAANPDAIMIATATYILTHYADGLHLTNDSQRILGEYMAKPYVARMQGRTWRPLSIKSAVLMGKTIIADFYVPVAPIVIDTATVTEPSFVAGSKYGFEFDDGSGSPPAISSITVVGPTTLEIVLAATPASGTKFLNYAYTGAVGVAAGPTTGARGCLRDSDTWRSLLGYGMTINGVDHALPNWCLHQHFQL